MKLQNNARSSDGELMRAKMDFVAARERGEQSALPTTLARHPAYADELVTFATSLMATDSYETADVNAPDVREVAVVARSRAFAAVFGTQVEVASAGAASEMARQAVAAHSLKALRQARGLSMKSVAERLRVGADVLSALESGRIRVASVPARFTSALSDLLDVTLDQLSGALSFAQEPALRRSSIGARSGDQTPPQVDFVDAIRHSPGMSADDKTRWLAE